jgi:hypothetical protein
MTIGTLQARKRSRDGQTIIGREATTMVTFSGSFAGNARPQTIIGLSDVPNHALNLDEVSGPQHSIDPQWNDARVTYWDVADLVAGSGPQRGYFLNEHADGDQDYGANPRGTRAHNYMANHLGGSVNVGMGSRSATIHQCHL